MLSPLWLIDFLLALLDYTEVVSFHFLCHVHLSLLLKLSLDLPRREMMSMGRYRLLRVEYTSCRRVFPRRTLVVNIIKLVIDP